MDLYNQIVERLRIAGVKFNVAEWPGDNNPCSGEAETRHAGFCWSWDPQDQLGIYVSSADDDGYEEEIEACATAQDVERLLGWFLAQAARP